MDVKVPQPVIETEDKLFLIDANVLLQALGGANASASATLS
jgi:hypothetical protein